MLMESNYVVINQIKIELIFDNNVSKTVVMKTDDIVVVSYKKDNTKANIKGRVDSIRYQVNSSLGRIASTIYAKIDGSEEYEGQIVFIKPTDMLDVDVIKTSDIIIDPVCSVSNQDQKITLVRENEVGEFQYSKDGMVWNSPKGPQGLSAYEVVVKLGFEGTEAEWLASLKGIDGISAYDVAVKNGYIGTEKQWLASLHGLDGISAYEVAVENGYIGTQEEWLTSLHGISAYEIAVKNGYTGTEDEWLVSLKGLDGISAYQVAVENGFTGTQEEWLESLKGISAYQVAVINGFVGTETEWIASLKGEKGEDGIIGVDGKSAYEVAVENGFVGTQEEWLESLKGEKGEDGVIGKDGISAYQIAVVNGFVGTESEWLESLKGIDGVSAYQVAIEKGYVGTEEEWLESLKGDVGKSAYQVSVDNGYIGTEEEWLVSIKGTPGTIGTNGKSAYEIAVANGYAGTETEWLVYLKGIDGKSTYQIAVTNGFVGTEGEWLETLKGISAYQVAVANGFVGTETQWLLSLKGINGKSAYEIAIDKGYTGTETQWLASLKGIDGTNGVNGKSAYEIAVINGFVGTEEEWLETLKATANGKSAYQIAVDNGFVGTESEWLLSLKGSDASQIGRSAYQIAVDNGFVGTEAQWLESLQGRDGEQGVPGLTGNSGNPGETPRIDDTTKRWFIGEHDTGYVAVPNVIDIPGIPVALSQLTNDENFIKNTVDNLVNYYNKDSVYNKLEITTLLASINTIDILIVDQLPTENISNTTIYLLADGENIYSQHMHTENGWANLGTTNIDLHNYVTITDMQTALSSKSNTDHTHAQLHTHTNKAVLDTITQELIQKWNNNFSGKYNDLIGPPAIPIVTNDLTNALKSSYDQAVLEKHTHNNMSTINKFSESPNGNPLYNNQPILADVDTSTIIDDNTKITTKTWSSDKISKQLAIVDEINIAQETVNKRGIGDLISAEFSYPIDIAVTAGTAVNTSINQTITLINDITRYDILNIQVGIKSSTRVFKSKINNFSVPQIIFNNTDIYNNTDGSLVFLAFDLNTVSAGAYGVGSVVLTGWFKSTTQFFIYNIANPFTDANYNQFSIFSMQGMKVDSVTIDPVEYVNVEKGIEDAPVGHVINMMSLVAPTHYLKCDGTIYNITDYPYLSQHIKTQFGVFNFFGGDGVTTFAVPDLRGEFLRGTGTANRNTGSGANVGAHQDGTDFTSVISYDNSNNMTLQLRASGPSGVVSPNSENMEKIVYGSQYRNYNPTTTGVDGASVVSTFKARPTNTSVLYCIKYEPTYFMSMEGFINEVTLWEGNVGTTGTTQVSNSINLKDSYTNYNKIGVFFASTRTDGGIRPQYREIYTSQITDLINDTSNNNYSISFTWGYNTALDYTDIKKTSTPLRFDIVQAQSTINKIIGIRYRTSSSGGGDDTTYTDSEIRDYVEGILNGNQ